MSELTADQADTAPGDDDQPSSSALVLVGLLVSLVALLLVGVIVAVGWGAGGDNPAVDSRSATAGLPDLQQELAANLWVLQRSDSSVQTHDENPVSLQFHDRGLSGLGPCNAYWGRVSVDQDHKTLQVTNLRHTERECRAGTMRAEREYFAALRSVHDIDLDDRDHLVLTNSVGDRLSYDSANARDELTASWRITTVGGHGRLDPPVDGSEPTITFQDDGTLVLHTGCNTLRASWALVGEQLATDSTAASTLKACDEGSGLQAQEELLSRVIDSGVRVHVAGGRLIVLDRFHRVLFVATDAGSASS
jgi:heat shock protein HslJ